MAAAVEWQAGGTGRPRGIVRRLVIGVDALVHAAVLWEGPRNRGRGSHGDPGPFLGVNLTGSLRLFQDALAAGVLIASATVYLSG